MSYLCDRSGCTGLDSPPRHAVHVIVWNWKEWKGFIADGKYHLCNECLDYLWPAFKDCGHGHDTCIEANLFRIKDLNEN